MSLDRTMNHCACKGRAWLAAQPLRDLMFNQAENQNFPNSICKVVFRDYFVKIFHLDCVDQVKSTQGTITFSEIALLSLAVNNLSFVFIFSSWITLVSTKHQWLAVPKSLLISRRTALNCSCVSGWLFSDALTGPIVCLSLVQSTRGAWQSL